MEVVVAVEGRVIDVGLVDDIVLLFEVGGNGDLVSAAIVDEVFILLFVLFIYVSCMHYYLMIKFITSIEYFISKPITSSS